MQGFQGHQTQGFEDKVQLGEGEGGLALPFRPRVPSGVEDAPDSPGPGLVLRLPMEGVGPARGPRSENRPGASPQWRKASWSTMKTLIVYGWKNQRSARRKRL